MWLWSAQAEAERLTLRVAESKTGYFGVYLTNPGQPKPYKAELRRAEPPVRAIDGSLATGSLVTARAESRLLNYLKTPHVIVWSASRASCSVPGVYAPSPLLERAPDGSIRYEGSAGADDDPLFEPALYVDGSMGADLPATLVEAIRRAETVGSARHQELAKENPTRCWLEQEIREQESLYVLITKPP